MKMIEMRIENKLKYHSEKEMKKQMKNMYFVSFVSEKYSKY
jgi:hypothetical protein